LLFEADRRAPDAIPLALIDRGVFAKESVLSRFPLPGPSPVGEPDDARRVRAVAMDVLERCAREEGSTLLPKQELISRVRAAPVDPKCALTTDLFDFSEAFLGEELTKSEGANGESNFQLHRLALVGDRSEERRVGQESTAPRREQKRWNKKP